MRHSVLHTESGPETRWTTVNFAEVQPGVLTPLGYTWWSDACEAGTRGAFADAGVIPERDVRPPTCVDERLTGIFYGRYAGNLTTIGRLADLTPGTSSTAFEIGIFGRADHDVERISSRRRYPMVIAKMPLAVLRLPRRLARLRAEVDLWWRTCTTRSPGLPEERLVDAAAVVSRAMRAHILTTLVAQSCFDRVSGLAADAGYPGLELELTTGLGGLEELVVAADLWAVSRGGLSLAGFLAAHGYHGPFEGELSSRSWRQDPGPVERAAAGYARLKDDQAPQLREAARRRVRLDAEQRLVAAAPLSRPVLRLLRRFMPLREVAKASFIQAVDVGRHAACQMGDTLSRDRRIDHPDDIFMLTLDEVLGCQKQDWTPVVTTRRRERDAYLRTALPERWTGQPTPVPAVGEPDRRPITGIPVSPGIVEGTARVVLDPADAPDFDDGDILVCETTDPSWVILFQLAAAVVIDVGGVLSHGAIVARELGIPAVINVRTGTRDIREGDRIRVDGAVGCVEILREATVQPETRTDDHEE